MMWYTGCSFTSVAFDDPAPAAGTGPGSHGCDDCPPLLTLVAAQSAAKARAAPANIPAAGPFLTLPLSSRSGLHPAHPE